MSDIKIAPEGPDIKGFVAKAACGSNPLKDAAIASGFRTVKSSPPGSVHIKLAPPRKSRGMVSENSSGAMMDYDLMMKLPAELAAEASEAQIVLGGGCEPFSHPLAMSFVREARRRNLRLRLETDCTLIEGAEVSELLSLGVEQIDIAADSFLPETYVLMHGSDGLSAQVARAYEALVRLRGVGHIAKPRVVMTFHLNRYNAAEAMSFARYWGDKVAEVVIYKGDLFAAAWRGAVVENHQAVPGRYICTLPWRDMFIDSDGKVYVCGRAAKCGAPLGDIRVNRLSEIWTGEPYMKLREDMLYGSFGKNNCCGSCRLWNLAASMSYAEVLGALFSREDMEDRLVMKYMKDVPETRFDYNDYLSRVKDMIEEYRKSR